MDTHKGAVKVNMVLWVKKRVKQYTETDNVPKDWKNLKRSQHVTTFRHYYMNMAQILVEEYGLSWDEKILVQSMVRLNIPGYKGYRTKPRKVFYGTVREFRGHVWDFFDKNIWKVTKGRHKGGINTGAAESGK